jgi:predicted 3-demethylubiquinone-9 3-methyltransferase (glyoxalase superfamily)
MPRTYPCLWFDNDAKPAADFYTSVFPNSRITTVAHYPEGSGERAGQVLTVAFELDGAPYVALNGGPQFTFDEAISITIDWLKDRFGLSWQVVPENWDEIASGDPERAAKVFAAMMQMKKLDIAALETAGQS